MATLDTWKNLAEFAYESLYTRDVSRLRIAQNPHTSTSTLEMLALDCSTTVRAAVAANPRTPHHILSKLARDQDRNVRMVLAASTDTCLELLRELALDTDDSVSRAARNSFRILQAELGAPPVPSTPGKPQISIRRIA